MTSSGAMPSDAERLAAEFDLEHLPDDFYADPYRYYEALRTYAPMKRMPNGSILLTRYADLERVYRNASLFSSDKREEFRPRFGNTLVYEHHTTSLVFNDPPLHTHVRRALQGAMAPKAIACMEPQLITLVDGLLDRLETLSTVDLIDDFAAAIPVEVIGNLLGIPHEDRGPLRGWSLLILGALEPVISAEQLAAANKAVESFLAYLKDLTTNRRAHLRDPAVDVLSRLILGEQNGERLTDVQLLQNCIFLLNAGHETTTNFIGNSMNLLMSNIDVKDRLISDQARIPAALEECLRLESPNQLGNRAVAMMTELGGETLGPGTLLTLCIGAANRDPEKFENPNCFVSDRTPNRHLAFATGPHMCLGLGLARLEARVAVARLLNRFPGVHPAGRPTLSRRVRFRGFTHLPAALT